MLVSSQVHVHTRRARMTRRPPVSECRDETTCLRPNVLTRHKVSPDTTRQRARHSQWNCSEHLNRRQPTRNVRRTDATKSHCCRTTRSTPIETPLRPRRTQKRQRKRHMHVTSNFSDVARCIRAYCQVATNAMITDELAKTQHTTFFQQNRNKLLRGTLAPPVTAISKRSGP